MGEGTDNEFNIQISETNSKKPLLGSAESKSGDEIRKRLKNVAIFTESTAVSCTIVVLIASLTVNRLHNSTIWELKIWKWCLLILAILSGRSIAYLVMKPIRFLIWNSWVVDEKVLYFAYGVKKSVAFFIWLCLGTLSWDLLVKRSKNSSKIADDVSRGLVGCVIGAAIWVVKTWLVRLVGSFHARKLFDKIKEAVSHRMAVSDISNMNTDKNDYGSKQILRQLIKAIQGKKLDCLSCINQKEITSAQEAKEAANLIFMNLGGKQIIEDGAIDEAAAKDVSLAQLPSKKPKWYLDLDNLLQFVQDDKLRKYFEELAEPKHNTEAKHIKRSVFRHWLVEAYNDYDSLDNTLMHSKTAIDDLNKIASSIILIIIIIVWLLFMEILTTKAFVFISAQFVLLAFIFGNTVKTVFEAVVFVFMIHPFDVGDRCVIDGVQMVVDEMRILSTTFLKYNNEKIYYPNSVLGCKPISNLYRSPPMSDSVEFAIDLSTPMDVLEQLKERIKMYLVSNPRRWKEDHGVRFQEIEDVNKMKMGVYVGHTVNFHYAAKRGKRRSDLVLEMKKIFEQLGIKYHLLPREVHLKYV